MPSISLFIWSFIQLLATEQGIQQIPLVQKQLLSSDLFGEGHFKTHTTEATLHHLT